jgi:DNA-binding IclR family transcriptional regulator
LKQFGFAEKDLEKILTLWGQASFLGHNVLDNLSYPDIVAPFLQNLAIEMKGTFCFRLNQGGPFK